jgi:hypothetical protein
VGILVLEGGGYLCSLNALFHPVTSVKAGLAASETTKPASNKTISKVKVCLHQNSLIISQLPSSLLVV